MGRGLQGLAGAGQPPSAPGLSIGAAVQLGGALNTARLSGGGGGYGNMQQGANCGVPAAQGSSYNPSGEILAMINKGQNLGLSLPQGHGMIPPSLPQGLGQGLPQGLGPAQGHGLGLGMPPPELNPSMVNASTFDMSEFPSLGQRAGNTFQQQFRPQSQQGAMPQVVQNEFAIQSEDFPALPGAAPASASGGSDGCGGGPAISVAGAACGGGGGIFRSSSMDNGVESVLGLVKDAGLHSHDDLGGSGGGVRGTAACGGNGMPADRADRFGLMGLLSVIRMTDQDLNTLALGTDLTTLGLNLNSSDCLYATFASPWADSPAQRDPEFTLPQCYYMQPPALKTGHFSKFQLETLFYIFYNMPRDTLQAYAATELYATPPRRRERSGHVRGGSSSVRQWHAFSEVLALPTHTPPPPQSLPHVRRYNRDWRYHKDLKLWFTRASRQGAQDSQKGQYIYFDINEVSAAPAIELGL